MSTQREDMSLMSNSIQQSHNRRGPLGPGPWAGIAICISFLLLCLLRYSYLASPFWLVQAKRRLRIRPSKRTPISHEPIYRENEAQESIITPPDPAHTRPDSNDALPLYRPTSRFSSDVLEALGSLETQPGTRPPSYRSKLSLDLRLVLERTANIDEEAAGRQEQARPVSSNNSGRGRRGDSLRRLFSRSS